MSLADELKKARIFQSEVAAALGTSASTVNRWFVGQHFPSGKHLPELLAFLNRPDVLARLGRTAPIGIDDLASLGGDAPREAKRSAEPSPRRRRTR